MASFPRLLPIVFVAVGGVLAMKAITSLDLVPGVFHAAEAFAAAPKKTAAKKAEKPAAGETQASDDPTEAYPMPADAAASNARASSIAAPDAGASGAPGLTAMAAAAASGASDAAAIAPAPVCATSIDQLAQQAGMSPNELQILQSLGTRRAALDQREAQLDSRGQLIEAADSKLDGRIAQLQDLKTQIQALLDQANKASDDDVSRLVAVYSAMKPKDAAAVMTTMDDGVLLPLAAKMKDRVLAQILGAMDPATARSLTVKLANRMKAAGGLQDRLDKAVSSGGGQAAASSSPAASAEASAAAAKPAGKAKAKAKAKV